MRISIDDIGDVRAIRLEDALLCAEISCSTIFTNNLGICPACGGETFLELRKILNRGDRQSNKKEF